MNDWFTIEKIDSQTFIISEYKHWEETHCYLLCGAEEALLIDSGLGVSDIRKVVDKLTSLPVTVLTTHVHWDHIGGHGSFDKFAVHELEKEWITTKFPLPLQAVKKNLTEKPCEFPAEFNINDYQLFQGEPYRLLRDGDILDIGGRSLEVVHTPGHSPGHCCFYESDKKRLYSGDLIYKGCLDAFYPTTDPQAYYRSIMKLDKYEIDSIYPGHYELNIKPSFIDNIKFGFESLDKNGRLKQGEGVFEFEGFQIHL